jgi:BMFP domain-containing protein YqiC
MFAPKEFEDLAKKLFATLPSGVQNLEKEIKGQFKDILQAAFDRMDLVTREEFDVQIKVLARTREKIEALQKQLDLLQQEKNSKSK